MITSVEQVDRVTYRTSDRKAVRLAEKSGISPTRFLIVCFCPAPRAPHCDTPTPAIPLDTRDTSDTCDTVSSGLPYRIGVSIGSISVELPLLCDYSRLPIYNVLL